MQQKTLIALGALAVIAVLTFMTLQAPQKGERVGPRARPIAAIKSADIKELDITVGKATGKTPGAAPGGDGAAAATERVVLKADGTTWSLVEPMRYAADPALIKSSLEQLEKISFGDMVTEKKDKHADLELTDDKAAHVVAKDKDGKAIFDAYLGKSVSGFTMVRPGGKDEVWQATGAFKYTYAREPKAWRDHGIFKFERDDLTALTVEAGGQKLSLEKPPVTKDKDGKNIGESKWAVKGSTVKVEPLDDGTVTGLVQALANLSAADFDDKATLADAGLAPPRVKVTATVKGQPMTLLVGNAKGDDNWVAVDGKPQIYLLHKYSMDHLAQRPADFRDKSLVSVKGDELTALDITDGAESYTLAHEGASWKFGKGGKGELDDAKVKPLVTALDGLKGNSFAESSDAATTGLGKPTGQVTAHLRDGSQVQLKVGAQSKDGSEYFVAKTGSPDVLMVKKFLVERFLKKPSDLVKAAK